MTQNVKIWIELGCSIFVCLWLVVYGIWTISSHRKSLRVFDSRIDNLKQEIENIDKRQDVMQRQRNRDADKAWRDIQRVNDSVKGLKDIIKELSIKKQ